MASPDRVTDELVEVRHRFYSDPETNRFQQLIRPTSREGFGEDEVRQIRASTLVLITDRESVPRHRRRGAARDAHSAKPPVRHGRLRDLVAVGAPGGARRDGHRVPQRTRARRPVDEHAERIERMSQPSSDTSAGRQAEEEVPTSGRREAVAAIPRSDARLSEPLVSGAVQPRGRRGRDCGRAAARRANPASSVPAAHGLRRQDRCLHRGVNFSARPECYTRTP